MARHDDDHDDDIERWIERSDIVTRGDGGDEGEGRPATKQTDDPARDPHDDDPAMPEEGAD